MTNPADRFKASLQARNDSCDKRSEELKEKALIKEKQECEATDNFLKHLPGLITKLKDWAELGGLKTQRFPAGYTDYGRTYRGDGLKVSDENKTIVFYPGGVSRTVHYEGMVDIQLPVSIGFQQFYFGLDSSIQENEPVWYFVHYDSQSHKNVKKIALNEVFFFQLMEEIFLP